HVCYEHRWEHWATRHVGARLIAVGNGRPNHWGYFAIRVGDHRRNRVVSCGRTGGGLHLNLANTQREGVFVIVEELQRLGEAVGIHRHYEGAQHPRLVEGDIRSRVPTYEA